jgi:hypothetical protein
MVRLQRWLFLLRQPRKGRKFLLIASTEIAVEVMSSEGIGKKRIEHMNLVMKVIRANEQRVTRFCTE